MGVGNLACNPANQKKILQEGAVPALVSLARFENGDLEGQRYAMYMYIYVYTYILEYKYTYICIAMSVVNST
jgi:hypothetical protein